MPPLVTPDSTSPGKLYIEYDGFVKFQTHVTSVNLVAGDLPATPESALAMATDLAQAIAPVLRPEAYKARGWRITNDTHQTVYAGGFAAAIVGTHAEPLLDFPSLSQTIEFGGRGQPGNIDFNAGQARMTLFTAGTYTLGEGDKTIISATDPALVAFSTHLAESGDYWADTYGQKCNVRGYVNVQFNARAQQRYGS